MKAERFYRIAYKIIRFIIFRPKIIGRKFLRHTGNVIFVANHLGSFGPIVLMSSLPKEVHPWVTHEIMDKEMCSSYLRKDFIEKEIRLKPPLSIRCSDLLAHICVRLMNGLKAIPVYRKAREMRKTIEMSLFLLEKGKKLLIFPENANCAKNEVMCEIDTGFIKLARRIYEKTKKGLAFIPIAVNKKAMAIRIGSPIYFNPHEAFFEEKRRIKNEIEENITKMYYSLEKRA